MGHLPRFLALAVALLGITAPRYAGGETATSRLPWVSVAAAKQGFVINGREAFVPWGFNYDHDEQGRLIEDYWNDEWPKIEQDFAEMKQLGANVVRVHLQFGKFMLAADKPNDAALDKLSDLVKLAEKTGLYLDLTGLGCYHKADVPAWYDALEEAGRWQAQGAFWEAVAKTCAGSPAIFCYDLMNEPVVPGGKRKDKDWLGPAFGDKHFVQVITLDTAGRKRPEIATAWIEQLVRAIRHHDARHLITVGLVDWSLERPGLTSGFVPSEVAAPLDFLCVHIYPEKDKHDRAMETLSGFAKAGKPVVIEETFPLRCSLEEFDRFLVASKEDADGWIGFYWGKTPAELKGGKTLADAVTLAWLKTFQQRGPEFRRP